MKLTMRGNPVTLSGKEIKVGDLLPDCSFVDGNLMPQKLSSFKGKPLLFMTVPSIDTPVCSLEAKKFNKAIEKLDLQVGAVLVSMDLPFAQKRWCAAEEGGRLQLFSDYRFHEVGEKFGVYITEVGLLARTVFIVDREGKVRYKEVVAEVTEEPNYQRALEEINKVV